MLHFLVTSIEEDSLLYLWAHKYTRLFLQSSLQSVHAFLCMAELVQSQSIAVFDKVIPGILQKCTLLLKDSQAHYKAKVATIQLLEVLGQKLSKSVESLMIVQVPGVLGVLREMQRHRVAQIQVAAW